MTTKATSRLAVVAALMLLALVPVGARWTRQAQARRAQAGRCALDGAVVVPLYRVRVCDSVGEWHNFCCVRCAELWLARQPLPPQAIRVTDEATGEEIDAQAATFVRSMVVTTPTTGNRIHVFASQTAAEHHADIAHGRLLGGSDLPLCSLPSVR